MQRQEEIQTLETHEATLKQLLEIRIQEQNTDLISYNEAAEVVGLSATTNQQLLDIENLNLDKRKISILDQEIQLNSDMEVVENEFKLAQNALLNLISFQEQELTPVPGKIVLLRANIAGYHPNSTYLHAQSDVIAEKLHKLNIIKDKIDLICSAIRIQINNFDQKIGLLEQVRNNKLMSLKSFIQIKNTEAGQLIFDELGPLSSQIDELRLSKNGLNDELMKQYENLEKINDFINQKIIEEQENSALIQNIEALQNELQWVTEREMILSLIIQENRNQLELNQEKHNEAKQKINAQKLQNAADLEKIEDAKRKNENTKNQLKKIPACKKMLARLSMKMKQRKVQINQIYKELALISQQKTHALVNLQSSIPVGPAEQNVESRQSPTIETTATPTTTTTTTTTTTNADSAVVGSSIFYSETLSPPQSWQMQNAASTPRWVHNPAVVFTIFKGAETLVAYKLDDQKNRMRDEINDFVNSSDNSDTRLKYFFSQRKITCFTKEPYSYVFIEKKPHCEDLGMKFEDFINQSLFSPRASFSYAESLDLSLKTGSPAIRRNKSHG